MSHNKLVVGLTGGIGSGKTAASNWFIKQGIDVIDTDVLARDIVAPNSPALKDIAHTFGGQALLPDGSLNRALLRQIVFNDAASRKKLEEITHPRIHAKMLEAIQAATSDYVVLVSALLLESTQHEQVNRILVIDAPESIQQARASFRDNLPEEHIAKIIAAQMPREKRLSRADDIIHNDKDIKTLHAHLEQLHTKYLEISRAFAGS